MPTFPVEHHVRIVLQSHLFVLELHLLGRVLLLQAVVLGHVHALTAAEAAALIHQHARLLRKVLLFDELQFGVGEIRVAEVTVGRRVQFVDEVQ